MATRIVHELPPDVWDAFLAQNPHATIHHTRAMFDVWNLATEYHPRLWAAVSGDDILALFIPVEISLMKGALRSFTSRSVAYGSFLYVPGEAGVNAVDELLRAYTRSIGPRSLFTELRNCTDLGQIQPTLQKNGFSFESHLNYLIDLTPPMEEIWDRLGKSVRKHIHAAQKKNLVIEELTDGRKFEPVYHLLKKTYERIRVPLPSRTFFEAAFQVLIPLGMMKARLICLDGAPISARLALAYKDCIVDWYTGSDRSFEKTYPEEFAIWQTLVWGREHGYTTFDFGGAGRPDEDYGPRIFKERFGGLLVNYGRNTFVHAPVRLRISKLFYDLYRRGWQIPFRSFGKSDPAP